VYGPLRPMGPILSELESCGTDIVGMYYVIKPGMVDYLQSWFVGMKSNVATADWFASFLESINRKKCKSDVIISYEYGQSALFQKHDMTITSLVRGHEKDDCFRNPIHALRHGIPFIKKSEVTASNIPSFRSIKKYIPKDLIMPVIADLRRKNIQFGMYKEVFQIRLFGIIPILDIKKHFMNNEFKIYLFKIPILRTGFKK
jgi:lipopolysaccharide biosynthesis protein